MAVTAHQRNYDFTDSVEANSAAQVINIFLWVGFKFWFLVRWNICISKVS